MALAGLDTHFLEEFIDIIIIITINNNNNNDDNDDVLLMMMMMIKRSRWRRRRRRRWRGNHSSSSSRSSSIIIIINIIIIVIINFIINPIIVIVVWKQPRSSRALGRSNGRKHSASTVWHRRRYSTSGVAATVLYGHISYVCDDDNWLYVEIKRLLYSLWS